MGGVPRIFAILNATIGAAIGFGWKCSIIVCAAMNESLSSSATGPSTSTPPNGGTRAMFQELLATIRAQAGRIGLTDVVRVTGTVVE